MKQGIVLAVAALALLAAGAAANRSSSGPAGAMARKASVVAEASALPSATPAPVVRTKPEADLALAVAQAFGEIEAARAGRWGRLEASGSELIDSKDREARFQAVRLSEMLRARPDAWDDVVDLLISLDPADAAVQTGRLLQDAVDSAVERRLAELLRAGSSAAKRVALALVGRRDSAQILSAVLAALDDPDPRLRFEVLAIIAERRARPDSPTAAATVEAALHRQVQTDPDRNLQNVARSILGEAVPAPGTPSRRSPRPFGAFVSKPASAGPTRSP